MRAYIRKMTADDKSSGLEMMRPFYASEYVSTNGSEEIFNADVNACVSDSPYAEGFVFECDREILGYAMIAKSFSTEFGRPCIWIEDIYVKEEFRNCGLGGKFFEFIESEYPDTLLRLEVEAENERAIHVYEKAGFDFFPYLEMKKLCGGKK